MKIQYASDLHLELQQNAIFVARNPFKAVGDVLVLAGDTLPLKDFDFYKRHRFFEWCSERFRQTLLVPGNHEYYRDYIDAYPDSWELPIKDNVSICENRVVHIDDTDFILATLWTHIPNKNWPALRLGMNDFHIIHTQEGLLTDIEYNAYHDRDLAFIKKAVSQSSATHKVVVTHHVPSRFLVAPEFVGSTLESGFTVDLTEYIETSGVDLWIYGHSHRNIDRRIGNTMVVSNQLGYIAFGEFENGFDGKRCFKLR